MKYKIDGFRIDLEDGKRYTYAWLIMRFNVISLNESIKIDNEFLRRRLHD